MRSPAMWLLTAMLLLAACAGSYATGPAPVSGPYVGSSAGASSSSSSGYGR